MLQLICAYAIISTCHRCAVLLQPTFASRSWNHYLSKMTFQTCVSAACLINSIISGCSRFYQTALTRESLADRQQHCSNVSAHGLGVEQARRQMHGGNVAEDRV